MIFSSFEFIFGFLPVTFFVFFALARWGRREWAKSWLIFASMFFYSYWNYRYLPLLLISIGFNYFIGRMLIKSRDSRGRKQTFWLTLGIVLNLAALGYFKYSRFVIENMNFAFGLKWHADPIILPLAISFFTFTQIAYLVDSYEGKTCTYRLRDYALFVTTFQHLIAGPIVHHRQLVPQFSDKSFFRLNAKNIAIGISVFVVGLAKKVLIADNLSLTVRPIFAMAAAGTTPSLLEGWVGALAYTLQLYFDFSGYSDMVIGLGLFFNLRLPVNFLSPYQAVNVTEFWRRWHISLTIWFRDDLYIPLGGNRVSRPRWYLNTLTVFLLSGLWHGAGWTFIVWGALHGSYLLINQNWQRYLMPSRIKILPAGFLGKVWSRSLTFFAVVVAWIFFRAQDVQAALVFLKGMFAGGGIGIPARWLDRFPQLANYHLKPWGFLRPDLGLETSQVVSLILPLLLVVFFAPNVMWWIQKFEDGIEVEKRFLRPDGFDWFRWAPTFIWSIGLASLTTITVFRLFSGVSEFLYFQF